MQFVIADHLTVNNHTRTCLLYTSNDPYVAKVEIWIDGELDHVAALPMRNTDRKVEPVSYTHLDVYKRQKQHRT